MAKHFYHIPLQNTLEFIKTDKSTLNTLYNNSKKLAYQSSLGRSYYTLEIEKFIIFFKIDRDWEYAIKTMEYFHSSLFIKEIEKILNFSQFQINNNREFFYAFCYLFHQSNNQAFTNFWEKSFLHYHNAFHQNSKISIDYQQISELLFRDKSIKESFGTDKEIAFFKIFVDDVLEIDERGKSIKTLRKKAYRSLCLRIYL